MSGGRCSPLLSFQKPVTHEPRCEGSGAHGYVHGQRNSQSREYLRFCFSAMGFRLRYEAVATALLRYLPAGVYPQYPMSGNASEQAGI